MNDEIFTNEENFRRFLLGEMTADERLEFEEKFIANEDLFENLCVAEDELVENYVRGTLSTADRKKFETNFLTTAKRRERVAFTREMFGNFAEKSALKKQQAETSAVTFWTKLVGFFSRPQIAFASVLAILAMIFGGWFLLGNLNNQTDLVKIPPTPTPDFSPLPQASEAPQIVEKTNQNTGIINKPKENIAEKSAENINKSNQKNEKIVENEPPKKSVEMEKPVITTLALFAGNVRSSGKTNELNLPKNSGGTNLQLNFENADYKNYRAEIVNQNGQVIYRSGNSAAKGNKTNVFVPAKVLKRGDYIVKLYGKKADGNEESVADYQFRVNDK